MQTMIQFRHNSPLPFCSTGFPCRGFLMGVLVCSYGLVSAILTSFRRFVRRRNDRLAMRQNARAGRLDFHGPDCNRSRTVTPVQTPEQILGKHPDIAGLLREGFSYVETARMSGKSTGTVHKVKTAMWALMPPASAGGIFGTVPDSFRPRSSLVVMGDILSGEFSGRPLVNLVTELLGEAA